MNITMNVKTGISGRSEKYLMKILRVFIRKTSQTPQDNLIQIGEPDLFTPEADEIHISCLFSWDKQQSLRLKEIYEEIYKSSLVKLGGPAFPHSYKDEFVPGMYVKKGMSITTRGCSFNCPWCLVPKMEGKFRELKNIAVGNVIQDNNILLSNREHLSKVFAMLKSQRNIRFLGGLDSRLLKDWHIEALRTLKIRELWFSFDCWDRERTLIKAIEKLRQIGFSRNKIRCYVLAGFNKPIQEAEGRLRLAYEVGALPFIQVHQSMDKSRRELNKNDHQFVKKWSRPAIIKALMGK